MTQEPQKKQTEKSKPVAKGAIVRPKESKLKRIYHIFFAADPSDAMRSVITKVIFPDIQYTLNNVWKRFGDMMFYGVDEAAPRSNGNRRNYNNISKRNDSNRSAFQNESNKRGARLDEFKDWGYTRREDAVELVMELRDSINEYGYVDVAKIYEIYGPEMGAEAMPIHYKWGWFEGEAVFDPNRNVEMGPDGYWHIIYPKLRRM